MVRFGVIPHFSNITQGFLSIQIVNRNEHFLYMRNIIKVRIEGIGTYRLTLDIGCCVDLEKCFYVLDCACNLVSLRKLDKLICCWDDRLIIKQLWIRSLENCKESLSVFTRHQDLYVHI